MRHRGLAFCVVGLGLVAALTSLDCGGDDNGDTAGTGGTAGAAGSTGGKAGSGGKGGSAGATSGTAGKGGSGGSTTGAAGDGGAAGNGTAGNGGSAGKGGAGGSGGAAGTGGSAGKGGAGGSGGTGGSGGAGGSTGGAKNDAGGSDAAADASRDGASSGDAAKDANASDANGNDAAHADAAHADAADGGTSTTDAHVADAADGGIPFSAITAIFNDRCISCHRAGGGLLDLETPTGLIDRLKAPLPANQDGLCGLGDGGDAGAARVPIVPGDTDGSFLYLKITGSQPAGCFARMPRVRVVGSDGGPAGSVACDLADGGNVANCLSNEQIDLIGDWIGQGAHGN